MYLRRTALIALCAAMALSVTGCKEKEIVVSGGGEEFIPDVRGIPVDINDIDWDQIHEDMDAMLTKEDYPQGYYTDFAVYPDASQINLIWVLKDDASAEDAVAYGAAILKAFNDAYVNQDNTVAASTDKYYGGLWDKWEAVLQLYRNSDIMTEGSYYVNQVIAAGSGDAVVRYVPTETTDAEQTGAATGEASAQIANPWTQSDRQGVADATGFEMTPPEGAENVAYSYTEADSLAQMTYELNSDKWTYRMQEADKLTDISGMYYTWDAEEKGEVSGREAIYYSYGGLDNAGDDIQVVNWYDAVTGVTYSLSAVGSDLNGMDIQAHAESLYVPLQGEATDDPERDRTEELNDYFLGEHKRSSDDSTLTISDNGDGTFKIDISITRLCDMEGGAGSFADHKMSFTIDDPNGEKMTGVIYRDSDNSLTIKITDSTWTYIQSGEILDGFGK